MEASKKKVSVFLENSPLCEDYILLVSGLLQIVRGQTIVIECDKFRYTYCIRCKNFVYKICHSL